MCEHRWRCLDCGEPQALEPDSLCPACERAEAELEQYILEEHDAEPTWSEMTPAERLKMRGW